MTWPRRSCARSRRGAPARVSWQVAHPQVHELADIVTAHPWLARLSAAPRATAAGCFRESRRICRRRDRLAGMAKSCARNVVRATRRRRRRRSGAVDGGNRHPAKKSRPVARRAAGQCPGSLVRAALSAQAAGNCRTRRQRRLAQASPSFFHCGGLRLARSESLPYCLRSILFPGLIFGASAIVFGVGLLVRITARPSLIGLLALTILQAAHYCVTTWHLGYLPLAALSAVPIMLAMLFTLAILDDR